MNMSYSYFTPAPDDHKSLLIKKHLQMVENIVERMVPQVPSFMSRDDMMSAAMVGLINAAERFDESKGILFSTFAEHRIRGAIFDEVRKLDWFSRSLREKHSRLTQTIGNLEKKYGRTPDEEEVAAAMHLDIDAYRDVLRQVCHLGCVSLHETLDNSNEGRTFLENLADTNGVDPLTKIEASELAMNVAEQLEKLTEKERLVVSLYYYEELNQKEIAEVLEVSEGRVSQLHSQALIKLKTKLQKEMAN
jgi:RNA polymerase sigma factor for flagellar operon FliA